MLERFYMLLDDTGAVQPRPSFRQECALMAARGFIVMVLVLVIGLFTGVIP